MTTTCQGPPTPLPPAHDSATSPDLIISLGPFHKQVKFIISTCFTPQTSVSLELILASSLIIHSSI